MRTFVSCIGRGVLIVLLMSATGCMEHEDPGADSSNPVLTIDEQFTRMARELPGFGGYYYDDSGVLNVVLTQPSRQRDAARALLSSYGLNGSGALAVQQGQYDFVELSRWRSRLDAEMLSRLVFTDVDEVRNRVAVGVSPAARAELVATMARLLIPAEAVIIQEAEPLQEHPSSSSSYLLYRNRPLAGGLQIKRYVDGFCTLGFNVRRNGKLGFFTNTHCTDVNTVLYQGPWVSDRLGATTEDPVFWTNSSAVYNGSTYTCPWGNYCRFSDAAYTPYDDAVQSEVSLGAIYRTQQENAYQGGDPYPMGVAHLEIDNVNPFFRIVGKAYHVAVGETIHKMGQRTGWTSGTVTATCANSQNGNTRLFCQMWGGGMGYYGDSGSPVFRRVPGSELDVELVGLYWGSAISPIGSIEQDFGTLDVVADTTSSSP
ncbi:hypothetical protein SAMN05444354_12692 [Stigmatella aurantiaca]|uniref:Uncharacterized protein n=1 Tax=Stigmatella aurantiaca TaxID=41 RepID=A0A1H8CLK7_STIAU|nr:hypothetical protein [Stigmatella aurantiaca]SEM94967.1 hypothetical protein SAMN05444354_12692 [Stigmatella aurantiaca]